MIYSHIKLTNYTEEDSIYEKTGIKPLNYHDFQKSTTNDLIVYPTHTTGTITIKNINNEKGSESLIQVYNTIGSLLFVKNTFDKSFKIDISDKSQGVYIIKVIQDGKMNDFKVIKE